MERWTDTGSIHSGEIQSRGSWGVKSCQFRGCSGKMSLKVTFEQEPEMSSAFNLEETLPRGGKPRTKVLGMDTILVSEFRAQTGCDWPTVEKGGGLQVQWTRQGRRARGDNGWSLTSSEGKALRICGRSWFGRWVKMERDRRKANWPGLWIPRESQECGLACYR